MNKTREGREVIKAWITTYALTKGIRVVENAEVCADISKVMLDAGALGYHHGCDWHRTEAEAIKRAGAMRDSKIASLEKRIATLRKMTFAPSGKKAGAR